MKQKQRKPDTITALITAAITFLTLFLLSESQAAGLLKAKSGDQNDITIKSHHVDVIINNGFARTEVDQIFYNNSDNDLEAIYSFPLPRNASLSELSLWINGQEVTGEVLEKQKARQIYEDQKAQGNQTAVAEQDSYKTFDISVYPVSAQDETRIRLVYYQPLNIDLNVGRYVYPLEEGGVDEERIAFWSVDSTVKESFTFDLTLKSAQPIQDVRMPGQPNALIENLSLTDKQGGNSYIYHASLSNKEGTTSLGEDLVFYYRLTDSTPARVELVPYRDSDGNGTFLLSITPAASLNPISEGVDWVFILDISGSMSGNKISTLTEGVGRVIGKMSPSDRFRVITFNDSARDITRGFLHATSENVSEIINQLKSIEANGGTALHAGLSEGLKKLDGERTSSVILVTDGVANIGPTGHDDFLQLVDEKDIRLFTFIIGNSSNRPLLDDLAKASNGFAMDVSTRDDIYGKILQAKNKVLYQAMHDVQININGGMISDLTPAQPGSLYRGQQLVMFGHYQQPGPVTISMEAKISGQTHEWSCEAILPELDTNNPEIERLWALSSITDIVSKMNIHGESESLRQRIVDLATGYSIVTDYTSMVVLDEQEMENLGIDRKNSQRINKERTAQQKRQSAPTQNYRVDKKDNSMFHGASSPGIGSGPVGPWFLIILAGCVALNRKKKMSL